MSWPKVRLGDICEINLGKTPPRGVARMWDETRSKGCVWSSIADMANLESGYLIDTKEYVSKAAVEECDIPVVKEGTLLVSFKLTLGRTAIAGRDLYTNEAIAALPFRDSFAGKVDIDYLRTYFAFFDWDEFARKDEKVLGKTLNKKKLAVLPVVLPPLAEQEKIVEKVKKALKRVDALKAQFERMEKSAADYFKAALAETFAAVKGEKVKLGDVCESISVRGHQIKQSEIGQYGAYPVISQSENEIEGYTDQAILVKDVPLVLFGDHTCVVKKIDFPFVVGADGTKLLKPLKHDVSYFYYYCTWAASKLIDGKYRRHYSDMAECMMPKIDMADQISAVQRLDAAKSKSERMVAAARRGIEICGKMRKAILAEAFQ